MSASPAASSYPFRPWVRSTCRRAMIWGVGVVALLGLVAWLFRTPGSAPLGRAFGVLAGYGLLFWLTLFKVWWTAGQAAMEVDERGVAYQPLHTFRPGAYRGSGCWPAHRASARSRCGWWCASRAAGRGSCFSTWR